MDELSIQHGLYKACYVQFHSPNYPQKIIITFCFLLVELETNFTIFYDHTLKYHNT
jgi:hypothetical protein